MWFTSNRAKQIEAALTLGFATKNEHDRFAKAFLAPDGGGYRRAVIARDLFLNFLAVKHAVENFEPEFANELMELAKPRLAPDALSGTMIKVADLVRRQDELSYVELILTGMGNTTPNFDAMLQSGGSELALALTSSRTVDFQWLLACLASKRMEEFTQIWTDAVNSTVAPKGAKFIETVFIVLFSQIHGRSINLLDDADCYMTGREILAEQSRRMTAAIDQAHSV